MSPSLIAIPTSAEIKDLAIDQEIFLVDSEFPK